MLFTFIHEPENQHNFEISIRKLEDYKQKIKSIKEQTLSDIAASLRGWEGAAAKVYFKLIAKFMPQEYTFSERSQHPAKDIFNTLLNYGYGILYGKIKGALIKAGIDPYVGIFHREDYNRPDFVFSLDYLIPLKNYPYICKKEF